MDHSNDTPIGGEPWIGDASPPGSHGCGFGTHRCGAPVTLHLISESAIHGTVLLATCPQHASIARNAGPVITEHTPGDTDCQAICEQET